MGNQQIFLSKNYHSWSSNQIIFYSGTGIPSMVSNWLTAALLPPFVTDILALWAPTQKSTVISLRPSSGKLFWKKNDIDYWLIVDNMNDYKIRCNYVLCNNIMQLLNFVLIIWLKFVVLFVIWYHIMILRISLMKN